MLSKHRFIRLLIFSIVLLISLGGCSNSTKKAAIITPGAVATKVSIPTHTPVPTNSPVPPTNTPVFTNTPVPTDTPIPTDTPAPTVPPTDTPVPTNTPMPLLSLPFEDDFDNGISSEWRITGTPPLVSDGKLTAPKGKDVAIELAHGLPSNFTLEFTVFQRGGKMSILLSPTLRFSLDYGWMGHTYPFTWSSFNKNKWEEIDSGFFETSSLENRIRIDASGNSYKVYVDGQIINEMIYGQREPGAPLGIIIHSNQLRIDDLVIH